MACIDETVSMRYTFEPYLGLTDRNFQAICLRSASFPGSILTNRHQEKYTPDSPPGSLAENIF